MTFMRLVRFTDAEGQEHLGDAGPWRPEGNKDLVGQEVTLLEGDVFGGLTQTARTAVIHELLSPLKSVPIYMCIGVNYQKHADEAGFKLPRDPIVFTKPADALAGPGEVIPIPERLRNKLDYEGELCVVIGKDCKDVSESKALDCVLGYTVGNDVSARDFQFAEVSGGHFGYAKSFDKFGPIGPVIASSKAVADPHKLRLRTFVNGEVRQESGTDDLIWSIPKLIAHLSNGTTLRKGTVIMTGTPSGVAAFMKRDDAYLKDGDLVQIEISEIGTLANKIQW